MLKTIKRSTIALTAILAITGCNRSADTKQADEQPLADAADSLAWYLAEAYADYVVGLMDSVPTEHSVNFNPQTFADGFAYMLEPGIANAGLQYGAAQAAFANDRLMNIRSCGIPIDAESYADGFKAGLKNKTEQPATTARLDKLMTPVNSKLIIAKRKAHK